MELFKKYLTRQSSGLFPPPLAAPKAANFCVIWRKIKMNNKHKIIFSIIVAILVTMSIFHLITHAKSNEILQLRAELSSDKKTYNYGETPVFRLTVHNISDNPIALWINASDHPKLPEDYIFGTIIKATTPPTLHDHIADFYVR